MGPSYRCRLLYWWTFGIVTTVTGIWPVVNRTLPYFDGHLQPSYAFFQACIRSQLANSDSDAGGNDNKAADSMSLH